MRYAGRCCVREGNVVTDNGGCLIHEVKLTDFTVFRQVW